MTPLFRWNGEIFSTRSLGTSFANQVARFAQFSNQVRRIFRNDRALKSSGNRRQYFAEM
jgi:hypothetical protein